jgi:hypothetical protein
MELKEMCWLVAVYGDDIPSWKRERLFQHSSMPAVAGVIQDGRDFVGNLNDGRQLHRKREPHPILRIP